MSPVTRASARKVCGECGQEFDRPRSPKAHNISNEMWAKQRYCGVACAAIARGRARRVVYPVKTCEGCGKTYRHEDIPRGLSLAQWKKRKYCSQECNSAAMAQWLEEHRGEKNPNWKGDAVHPQTARQRARKMYPDSEPCEMCGDENTERHHKDGQPTNNAPDNIAWLCRKHHIEIEDRCARRRRRIAA